MILNQLKMKLIQKQDLISIKLTLLWLWWHVLYVHLVGLAIIVNRFMYSKTPKCVMIFVNGQWILFGGDTIQHLYHIMLQGMTHKDDACSLSDYFRVRPISQHIFMYKMSVIPCTIMYMIQIH
jgi:hypothetical protein